MQDGLAAGRLSRVAKAEILSSGESSGWIQSGCTLSGSGHDHRGRCSHNGIEGGMRGSSAPGYGQSRRVLIVMLRSGRSFGMPIAARR